MTKDVKDELFGRVNIRRTGNHVVNPKHLHEPFEGPRVTGVASVAYLFCRGCGLAGEVNEPQARRLAAQAGTAFEDAIPTGIYFEIDSCPFCGYGEDHAVEVKPLPPRPNDQGR